jgi:hypothetical protein
MPQRSFKSVHLYRDTDASYARRCMQMMKVDCQEVASAEEVDARGWLNAIWTSSMWLISASHDGCCIRDVMALHHARLQTLIAELAPIAQRAHMRDFSVTNGLGEEADIAPIRGAMGAHVAGNDLLGVDMVMSDIQARSRQYRVGAHVPCKQEALRQVRWLNGFSPALTCPYPIMRTRPTHTCVCTRTHARTHARTHTHTHTHTHTCV